MKEFDLLPYITYFKNLAGLHKAVRGFYIMDINEVMEDIRSDLLYPALILNSVSGFVSPNTTRDNFLSTVKSGFLVIDHLEDPGDYALEMAILHNTFSIGRQLVARILQDCSDPMAHPYQLDTSSVKFEMMDAIFNHDFGFMFTFDLKYRIGDMKVDPDQWLTTAKNTLSGF